MMVSLSKSAVFFIGSILCTAIGLSSIFVGFNSHWATIQVQSNSALEQQNKRLTHSNLDVRTFDEYRIYPRPSNTHQQQVNTNSGLKLFGNQGQRRETEIDDILATLFDASVAFNTPQIVNIDDTFQIQLLLSLNHAPAQLSNMLNEVGARESLRVRVSRKMEASLKSSGFEVASITPQIQAISHTQETQWRWAITPKASGKHKLHLSLNAFVDLQGDPTPRTVQSLSRDILVKVTVTQTVSAFFESNWQWLWTTILVPFALWFWSKRKQPSK